MRKLTGTLLYMGWFNHPWRLATREGDVDLWPPVETFLVSLNGKPAAHDWKLESYTLAADDASEFQFAYVPGERVLLEKVNGFGVSNVYAYLDEALRFISGRLVHIEIEDGVRLYFSADPSEEVFGVYFRGHGNSCEVPRGAERTICKIGEPDCCIFLACTAGGFTCEKFNGPIARMLLDHLAENATNARRIGNCAIRGRK